MAVEALLSRPRPLLLDGATGTELARRGVETTLPLWSAHAFTRPGWTDILAEIHLDYARAGAEVLVTNTFRTTLRALGKAGRGGDWRSFNEQAVACARRAAESSAGTCLVAGGIAPLEECYSPDLVPDDDDCLAEHRRQVELLASFDVDLILIETMNCEREARAALVAARESGLDVLLSLCPQAPAHLLSGEALTDVVPRLVDEGGVSLRGILLNCASPEVLEVVVPRFASLVPALPHGVYAHLGEPDANMGWRLPEQHEPERYADWVGRRLAEGARIVGGCCGTTPGHIRAVAQRGSGPVPVENRGASPSDRLFSFLNRSSNLMTRNRRARMSQDRRSRHRTTHGTPSNHAARSFTTSITLAIFRQPSSRRSRTTPATKSPYTRLSTASSLGRAACVFTRLRISP